MPGSLSINRPRVLSQGSPKIPKSVRASQDRGTWRRLIFKTLVLRLRTERAASNELSQSLGLRTRLLGHLDQHSPSLSRIAHLP